MEWLPENSTVRYELHNRNIIEIVQPVGKHQEVTGFLTVEVGVEIKNLELPLWYPSPSDS